MKKSPSVRLLCGAALLFSTPLFGGNLVSNWVGEGSGSQIWEDNDNWSTALYPNKTASDTYNAVLTNATGSRVIQTSGDITLARFKMEQSSDSGANTLKLGGNFYVTNEAGNNSESTFANTTNDPTRAVIDLNGYEFRVTGANNTLGYLSNVTLTGGGIFSIYQLFHENASGKAVVGPDVTVRIYGPNAFTHRLMNMTWDATSTLKVASNTINENKLYYGTTLEYGIGNLVIGDATNTVATWASLNESRLYVKGNVQILSYSGATDGAAAKLNFGTANPQGKQLYIAGNFHDQGSDDHDYGVGTFVFNGSGNEQVLSTGRANLSTAFQVGVTGESVSHLRLGQDLTTNGKFTVTPGSTLDVDAYTLKAGSFDLLSSGGSVSTVIFTLGLEEESGLIDTVGLLSIGQVVVKLVPGEGEWLDRDVELFRFGSLSGTPELTIDTQGMFSFEGLVIGEHSIYLKNVSAVPEPQTVALFLGAIGVLFLARRRSAKAVR